MFYFLLVSPPPAPLVRRPCPIAIYITKYYDLSEENNVETFYPLSCAGKFPSRKNTPEGDRNQCCSIFHARVLYSNVS